MVSPRIGAIVRIATQTNIKTGKFRAATSVVIRGPAQIDITMRVMDGSRGLKVVPRQSYGHQKPAFYGYDTGHSNFNSTSSFSDVSSFVTCESVTFDARRNQGFPNACTVK